MHFLRLYLLRPFLKGKVCLFFRPALHSDAPWMAGRVRCLCFMLLIINFLIVTSLGAQGAADSIRLIQTLSVKATFAAADNLSNLYLITPENAIEKYAPDGKRLARYSNNRLGRAAWLDVSNPLKVLVWYSDFRTAVFLDRSLTDLGELNLITAGYPEVRTVAAAQDGNLWLYDEANFRLAKITPAGEKSRESQAMNLFDPTPARPTCLREGNDRIVLADSLQGVFVFDLFAQFDRVFAPQYAVNDFQIVDNQLHYMHGEHIVAEQLQVRASREVPVGAAVLKSKTAALSGGRLLVWGDGTVSVYEY